VARYISERKLLKAESKNNKLLHAERALPIIIPMATFSVHPVPYPSELQLPAFSEARKKILSQLESPNSLIVEGPAGSGKTVLALAAMRQLHHQDHQVRGLVP